MPILLDNYKPTFLNKFALLNAMYSSIYRKTQEPNFEEIKFETDDNDFFVSHWSKNNNQKLVVMLPGIMGNYNSKYNRGFLPKLKKNGFDVCILNARSTTEANRKVAAFHAAFYKDLKQLLSEIELKLKYKNIYLIGFSMGGSILLNYLGREYLNLSKLVKKAAIVSAPLMISPGAKLLAKPKNIFYMAYMYKKIRAAVNEKKDLMIKEGFDVDGILKAKTFKEIDGLFTAKAFGFKSAEDYWEKASCKPFLKNLNIPTLLINALDDPMLEENSYPFELAKQHQFLHFEATKFGGHMGFNSKNGLYFEDRILQFFED